MGFNTLHILLPLFLLMAGGFFIARCFSLSEGPLVRAVTDFFMPLLVFHSFCINLIAPTEIARILGAVSLLVILLVLLSRLYCHLFNLDFKAVAPPILFMNSGFLGIPVMKLWGGLTAMNLIILYDQMQTFYIFTLGIVIVTGSLNTSGLREIVRTPLIWAIVGGLGINLAGLSLPQPLLHALSFGGEAAPALAVFSIGMSLNHYRIRFDRHIAAGLGLRFVGGFLLGSAAALLLGFSGLSMVVIIVASALPSAVFSAVLPIRYGVDGGYASSMLVITTLLSVVTLPITFRLAVWLAG